MEIEEFARNSRAGVGSELVFAKFYISRSRSRLQRK